MTKKILTLTIVLALLLRPPTSYDYGENNLHDIDIGTDALTVSQLDNIVPDLHDTLEPVLVEQADIIETLSIMLSAKTDYIEPCKITNPEYFGFGRGNIGFPLPSYGLPNSGVIKVGVVYLDFADYRWNRTESTYELTEFLINPIQDYYNAMSNNRISFEWHVSDQVLSLSKKVTDYGLTRNYNPNAFDIKKEIMGNLSGSINYQLYDILLFAINPDINQQYGIVSAMSKITDQSGEYYVALIGPDSRYNNDGHLMIVHEFGHMFGLPDLYTDVCANNTGCQDGSIDWREQFKYTGAWSTMSFANHPNNELLAWERWLLGWVDDSEIHCVSTAGDYLIQINPTFNTDNETTMVIVNLEPYLNLVIEMKDQNPYCLLCTKGLLIYTVDTRLGGMQGPIKVLRPSHSTNIVKEDALLIFKDGYNLIETHEVLIQIFQENNNGFIVSISSLIQ